MAPKNRFGAGSANEINLVFEEVRMSDSLVLWSYVRGVQTSVAAAAAAAARLKEKEKYSVRLQ